MHFYPGVAQYDEPGKESQRIFINEDTIREMDATFAGKPIFVDHVDEVDQSIDQLRKEADGWVIESFFNSADGKHWVKFIVVSEKGDRAIRNGFRLSNAYIPLGNYGQGGLWNGVPYSKQVLNASYEHLAIVKNPRYEESVIMTPEQFKKYNNDKEIDLKRIANSKENSKMKFKFFKRQTVENDLDLAATMVELPLLKKEMSLESIINGYDQAATNMMANGEHCVMVGDEKMKVNDLVAKHMEMKKNMDDMAGKGMNLVDEGADNAMDEEEKKKAMEMEAEKKMNEEKETKEKEEKKENELKQKKANFETLQNAHKNVAVEEAKVDLAEDQVARGKARYGSN